MIRISFAISLCLCAYLPLCGAAKLDPIEIEKFVIEMQRKHAFEPAALRAMLSHANRLDGVLAAISKPAEYKPWHQYRPIFITEARIQGGREFWRNNEQVIAAAATEFGVPPEIIVSIIGVETAYGRNAGNYAVLEALGTLAFHYPPRAPFFRSELANLMLLAREEQIDPAGLQGSYAGAMGIPQFMPSSFRAYAVDFDQDGRRDIWNAPEDAIGSVANYLQRHGWQAAQPVALRALDAASNHAQTSDSVELAKTLAEFAALGVKPDGTAPATARAVLLAYEGLHANEYWLGLQNFYVITRYNRSPKYALAVFQLAEEIRMARARAAP